MTTTACSPGPRSGVRPVPATSAVSDFARYAVPVSAVVAVLARVPFLTRAASPDEAGFLLVGRQWHAGGSSLYGNYWVDRPPLLVTFFGIAADLGGVVPLRLLGCLATVLVVVGSAAVAGRIAGGAAAGWTAAAAAALCVSPLLGGLEVNGELLAAPFVVAGISAVLWAMREQREGRAELAAAVAGAATVAALLVKQNMADVGVFAAVAVVVAWRRGELATRRLWRAGTAYVLGAVLILAAMAGWTRLHGTSLVSVFDAMYPFRLQAGRVLATSSHQHATARLWLLLLSWVVSGGAVIMVAVTWALASRRLRGAAAWGLTATLAFDIVSIALGGNYWHHYLVQLVVPTAVTSGLLVANRLPAIKTILVTALVVAAVAWAAVLPRPGAGAPAAIGQAVGRASVRGDTIITAWGHADITEASGLSSPYPYLWSLPARTLDPKLATLDDVLAGPQAATWIVAWSDITSLGRAGMRTEQLLAERYHPVATMDGRTVYLLNGVHRPSPHLPSAATAPSAPTTPPKERS